MLAAAVLICGYVTTNAQTVRGSIGNGTVTRGTATRATVVMSIPAGLHTNSSRPSGEYMIPTTVRASAHGVKIGNVIYPRGRDKTFDFSQHPINVYEGRVTFTFPVTVPESYRGTSVAVRVTVRSQACTNEACYAPKTKNLTLTARVR